MTPRGIGMDDELWEAVDERCLREGITVSEFFRRAACQVLQRPDLNREVRRGRPKNVPKEPEPQLPEYTGAESLSPEHRIEQLEEEGP